LSVEFYLPFSLQIKIEMDMDIKESIHLDVDGERYSSITSVDL